MRFELKVSTIVLVVLLGTCCGCLEHERNALLQLFSYLNFNSSSIPNTADCCDWLWPVFDNVGGNTKISCSYGFRVYCNDTGRQVTNLVLESRFCQPQRIGDLYLNTSLFLPFKGLRFLELSGLGIVGCAENEGFQKLSKLKNLESLYLSGNRLNNSILSSQGLCELRHLRSLSLSSNDLSGSLPWCLANMTSLQNLDLSLNRISGVPLSRFKNLEFLDLSYNFLDNSILSSEGLCMLRHLRFLSLFLNDLSGSLPWCLANMTSLQLLDLSFNQISGVSILGFENLESLELSSNFLDNSILSSEGICKLRHLRSLSLYNNDLSGSLPWCLANMTFLQNLDISFNQISGDISFSPIKSLTSIEELHVGGNRFKVPISLAPLFNHSKLRYMDVQENELYAQREVRDLSPKFQLESLLMSSPLRNASYPEFLYHQHSLRAVSLSHIQFMGEFPYWLLENNTDLETLLLSNNSLSGPLQLPIHPHISLSSLDISRNSIHGHIPSELGEHFPRLIDLNMSSNALTGSIPLSLGNALVWLDLSNNKLCGGIQEGLFMGTTMLGLLNLGGNQISGNIPDSLSHLFSLNVLDISHNNLSGHIPEGIGSLSSLDVLDLSKNNLSGPLPTNFCPPQMSQLKLSNNKLFGSLTEVFCNCKSLITLDLGYNRFTGNIPDWIHRCSQLKFLLLSHNDLQGKIPIQLCALDQLNLIDLSDNNLSGGILPCLISHGNFHIQRENYSSSVGAPIPAIALAPNTSLTIAAFSPPPGPTNQRPLEFTEKSLSQIYQASILKYISGIDLSCNNLTGEIPPEIGNLSKIQVLNLSYNSLTGPIPVMFVNLKQIESLDLSYNKLYGQIPSQLTELTFLSAFSVAHNNLSGITPALVRQFATFKESSYEGNPLLCGMPLPKRCSEGDPSSLSMPRTEDESEEDNGFMDMEAFYVSFLVSYVIVLLVIAAVLYINPYWRRLCFAFIEATTSNFYYFLLDNLPLLSKFGLS